MCILCLSYPLCKSHPLCAVLHFSLWPVWLYQASSHYVTNNAIFGEKKLSNLKCLFWFSVATTFVWSISYSQKIQQLYFVNLHRHSYKIALYSCNILIKCENSRYIFGYYSIKKVSWKSVQWESSFSVWTDTTKLTVACRNFANTPKKWRKFVSRFTLSYLTALTVPEHRDVAAGSEAADFLIRTDKQVNEVAVCALYHGQVLAVAVLS